MGKRIDYEGKIINGWRIIERTGKTIGRTAVHLAVCTRCGIEKRDLIFNLRRTLPEACSWGHQGNRAPSPPCPKKDHTGKQYGEWTVLEELEAAAYKDRRVLVRCSCGKEKPVFLANLVNGSSTRCRSCSRRAIGTPWRLAHGHSVGGELTRTYRIWCGMRNRCRNTNEPAYPRYGGRGIEVCERWQVYENFLADMGECPPGLSIDRIDNDGNYSPENCRWADRSTQVRHRKKAVAVDGQIFDSMTSAGKAHGITSSSVAWRIKSIHFPGWSWEGD